jgi:Na+/melibiose symporter-like transporter
MNKENVRDKINELEFKRSKKLNENQRWLTIISTLLAVMVVFLIFELQKDKSTTWYLIFLGTSIVIMVLFLVCYNPQLKEEDLIKKEYYKLNK